MRGIRRTHAKTRHMDTVYVYTVGLDDVIE